MAVTHSLFAGRAASAGHLHRARAAQSPMRTGRSSTTPGAAFSCAAACPPNGAPTLKEKGQGWRNSPSLGPLSSPPCGPEAMHNTFSNEKGSGPASQRKGGAAMPPSGK